MRKRICLDPGHGGDDPGAIGFGIEEAELTLRFAGMVADRIPLHGSYELSYTHRGEGKSLSARAQAANDWDADLLVSLHCNAFHDSRANGFEVFTSRGDTGADAVASSIYQKVGGAFPNWNMRTDWSDGDIDKEAGFVVLKRTRMRAVLVELGFITNPVDHFILTDGPTSRLLAAAVAQGIVDSV
jgi:N-acetylmuramoyl-L-alanine amidase